MPELMTSPNAETVPETGSLIRAVEIWQPDEHGTLSIDQCYYDQTPSLQATSTGLKFNSGDGLPGQVFETQKPIVFRDFGDSDFARTEAAQEDGIVAGFGFPIIYGGSCTAVVVMLFGGGKSALGGLESWVPIRERNELTLESSYYAGMPRFEKISRYVQFPRGSGLPGMLWDTQAPHLLTGLSTSKSFMRAAGAGAEGLSSAIAWPICDYSDKLHSVCLMLSAARSPIARVLQVWQPGETDPLILTRTDAPTGDYFRDACVANPPAAGDGLIGAVFENQLPRVIHDLAERSDAISKAATACDLTYTITIPVFAGKELRGLVALWN